MNLEESNSYNQEIESRDRKRRAVMLSIILCGVFIALLFVMIIIISYQDSITEKFYIDGVQIKSFNNSMYTQIDGVTYVDVRTLSSALGYTYTKGEYKKYNENEDSCYLQSDYEIVTLSAGNDSYDKYIEITAPSPKIAEIPIVVNNKGGYSETYKLQNEIVYQNGKIYVPLDSLQKMFNINISWKEYRKKIYTLANRVANAKATIGKYGYTEMSGDYENLRAIIDGLVIVADTQASSKYYGVFSFGNENQKAGEILSRKYDNITYAQNVGEFYITVENGTMGLLNSEGGTIIDSSSGYEEISLLDDDGENQLYLVKKGKEYGVVSRTGEVLVHPENDEIGLKNEYVSSFSLEKIRNPKVLFDACIPVKKDGKYGLVNKDGEQKLNLSYEGFGYKTTATSSTSGNEQSVLLIPPSVGIKGIVVNYDDLYGIFDVTTQKLILPCVYSKIYAITRNGKTTYYIEYNGASVELKDYLEDNGLNNVDETGNPIQSKLKKELPKEDEIENNTNTVQTSGNVVSSEDLNNNVSNNTILENDNDMNSENIVSDEDSGVIELN